MAKRGYKLQEFLAHSTNVNCLSIGKKTSRLLITGGEDYKVNLWAIGKPTSLMSLCGHTSPVDSVAFDSAEVLVLAGASSGVIKLWDLEEAKMVRALTGHRSNCSAVEFHPFGEFFASGSMDTNLKIWDIRKKGCIHTYKGHTRGINTIRFTPDGRWVVSGGLDNVVKVWDLTAGKLLHDFKFHEGHIRSIDFHPLEFLLATGSADRTVKFWDLETFELIGSSRPEVTGVRSITFHPDGRTLFCGLDDSLKIYSWEPVVCHDGVDMGWSTLGDLCINEGKILGCSHYRNSVGIWVADISLIEPYGVVPIDKNERMEKRFSLPSDQSSDRGSCTRRCISPDNEAKEIKNIYVDSSGGNSTAAPKPGPLITPNVLLPLKSEKASNMASEKQNARFAGQAWDESLIVPNVVPRESDIKEDFSVSGRESITFSRTKPGMLLRPAHVRKTPTKSDETKQSAIQKKSGSDSEKEPNTMNVLNLDEKERKPCDGEDSTIKSLAHKFEKALSPEPPADGANCMLLKPPHVRRSPKTKYSEARQATSVDSGLLNDKKFELEQTRDIDLQAGCVMENRGRKPCEEDINVKSGACRFESPLSPETQSDELKSQESPSGSSESNSVKVVRGVTVVSGRTRSLVERFEKRETFTGIEDKAVSASSNQRTNIVQEEPHNKSTQEACTAPSQVMHTALNQPINSSDEPPLMSTRRARSTPGRVMPVVLSQSTNKKSGEPPVTSTRSARASPARLVMPVILNRASNPTSDEPLVTSTRSARASPARVMPVILDQANNSTSDEPSAMSTQSSEASPAQVLPVMLNQADNLTSDEPRITYKKRPNSTTPTHVMPLMFNPATSLTSDELRITSALPSSSIPTQNEEPQISGRENDIDITENLMQTHKAFLSTLQSRLTKLQIVRHFWERRDIKGAIGALKKLPDHSVQADVIGILMDKKQILTLDVFSLLLPVLTGLLGSNTERPANVSLEMLLKLVAVFNPVVRSTISAPRVVGVDLHAEQRFELCNSCFTELQKVQKILPELTRRGGLLARKAQELNLVLQQA